MAAAAYAALLALTRSLQNILDLQQYDADPLLHRQKVVSLKENVDSIVTFLEDYSDQLYHQTLDVGIHGIIRKAAFEAQDFIDSYLFEVSNTHDEWSSRDKPMKLDQDLNLAVARIDFILEETTKLNNNSDQEKDFHSRSAPSFPADPSSTSKNMVVGFDEDLTAIKQWLCEDSEKLQFISIVGMGGMGKTTLARRAYEDSLFSQYFDICAWITVSQEYQRRDILSDLFQILTKSDNDQSDNDQSAESEAQLALLVYQNLVGRRYLIVVDDIWSTKAWDDLKMIFPNECNGSRILLTTRILDVVAHSGSSDHTLVHQMKFFNEDQSWKLLQQRVFGQKQSCPPQLVEIGNKIAKICGGLPLTIVLVAGLLLSSGNVMKEESWENISENIASTESTIALQCSKILCFSYDRLPLRLKPCFLYIAAFPEDSKIYVSKLIKLWVSEGFLKPNDAQYKSLEDVGEAYLEDLVNRSLLLVTKKGPDGRLNIVGIHDMLREICVSKAEEEGFLHRHVSSNVELIEHPYRRIQIDSLKSKHPRLEILDPSVRSLLLSKFSPSVHVRSRHICILDIPQLKLVKFSGAVPPSTLANLRYFAFTIRYNHDFLLLSKYPNLETIEFGSISFILGRRDFEVPYEILKMPKLRHMIWNHSSSTCRLSYPSDDIGSVHESNLRTIFRFYELIFSEEMCTKIFVNLKKLKVAYGMKYYGWDDFNFDNICRLQNLEDLEISMSKKIHRSMTWHYAFPMGLKKLHLKGVPLGWENMGIIGSLPNLQALWMMGSEYRAGSNKWTTVEGQFLQLKYFHSDLRFLNKWETEKEHFPCLESLIMANPWSIREIPSGIGEIDSLQYIELRHCGESLVNSAKHMEKLQHENGNDVFCVRVIDTFHDVLF